MESIDAIGGGTSFSTPQTDAFSELTSEDFVKVIFAELGRQDPLEPNDTGALLDQISTLRSIQSDIDLADRLESITAQNELTSAGGLIGKVVGGIDEEGARAVDIVISVSRTEAGAVLNLAGGQRVPMSGVDEIVDLDTLSSLQEGETP